MAISIFLKKNMLRKEIESDCKKWRKMGTLQGKQAYRWRYKQNITAIFLLAPAPAPSQFLTLYNLQNNSVPEWDCSIPDRISYCNTIVAPLVLSLYDYLALV